MINNQIDKLIMEAMKSHENVRKEALRAIKAAFLLWRTQKENVNKPFTDEVEIQIIKKMVKQREDSIEQFKQANRMDLVEAEEAQLKVLKEFLPVEATREDILKCFNDVIGQDGFEPVKKNMGVIIKTIKGSLPNADGKLVAEVVQEFLNK
jgi:hypothetical protein